MNLIRYFVSLLILFLSTEIGAYKILGIFPLKYKSHNFLFHALMKGLAKRGHEVDAISYYEYNDTHQNYKTILNLATLNKNTHKSTFDSIPEAMDFDTDPVKQCATMLGINVCELMSHEKMQKIIKNPPKDPAYDLIITEGVTISCYYGLGIIFQVPIVTISASKEVPWISHNIGNPLSTAFFPTLLTRKSEIKTFWDRLQNTLFAKISIYRFFSFTENQSGAMKKYLDANIPTVREVERMVAVSLVNSHHTIFGIRPTTPAFIEVAGLHIEEAESNFTKELKEWMDESQSGVVYVALGTTIPIEILPNKTLQAIYSSFAKLEPIKVLMKTTNDYKLPPGLPKNVLTLTWIPQQAVLGHNNTRVFISHGGLHSIQEAIYYAVPVIGIPVFYDQRQNIEILVNIKKMGILLNHDEINEESLDWTLMKILKEPKYREAAKYHSQLFRDRPMSPMQTANFWIEYVIRNGGEPLRSPALDLYWFQNELLDVYGFLLLCFLLAISLILISLKIAFKMCFRKNIKAQLKRD